MIDINVEFHDKNGRRITKEQWLLQINEDFQKVIDGKLERFKNKVIPHVTRKEFETLTIHRQPDGFTMNGPDELMTRLHSENVIKGALESIQSNHGLTSKFTPRLISPQKFKGE